MTFTTTWTRRLRAALALLVLVPAIGLTGGAGEAEAATWTTAASGWSSYAYPVVGLGAATKAYPESLRVQTTNHAAKTRPMTVLWTRECVKKSGKIVYAEGSYTPRIGAGKTHTKTLIVPVNSVGCYVTVVTGVDNGVLGRVTSKLQVAY